jgi:hypothetical protein
MSGEHVLQTSSARGSDRKEFLELIERVANQMPEERPRGFIRDIPRMTGMVE